MELANLRIFEFEKHVGSTLSQQRSASESIMQFSLLTETSCRRPDFLPPKKLNFAR